MYVDPSGHFALTIFISAVVAGAISGLFDIGKQLVSNGWNFSNINWGSVINSAIVGAALGFSMAMGVAYLGPVIAGSAAATSGLSAGGAFAISSAVTFAAGAFGYSVEEWFSGRTPSLGKAIMHGSFVMLEGMLSFGVGGAIGSVGTIGRTGPKKLFSSERLWKFLFGQEFTRPTKIGFDLIRDNL